MHVYYNYSPPPRITRFTPMPSIASHFLSYMPFSDMCTELSQNDIEHYNVKDTSYVSLAQNLKVRFTFTLRSTLLSYRQV